MADQSVGLFDIVPWTHGYAHSWALRWMLEHHESARAAILGLFLPGDDRDWTVKRIDREYSVGRNRADLRVLAADARGHEAVVLVETKVNDAFREAQVRAFSAESTEVVIYAPGLTGLLLVGNDCVAHERWVTGRQLVAALTDVRVPNLVRSYLDEVAVQAERMEAARAAGRGDAADFPRDVGISGVSGDDVEAVAWVAEVAAAMRSAGAEDVITRDTAHDYGVFWSGSWRLMPGFNGAGVYIDVIAGHGGNEYALTAKVSEGGADDRIAVLDAASDPPWPGNWRRGRRRRSNGFRLWTLDASEMTAGEAADATLRLGNYLTTLARSHGRSSG